MSAKAIRWAAATCAVSVVMTPAGPADGAPNGDRVTAPPASPAPRARVAWQELSPADLGAFTTDGAAEVDPTTRTVLLYPGAAHPGSSPATPLRTPPMVTGYPPRTGLWLASWSDAGGPHSSVVVASSAPGRPRSNTVVVVPDYTWQAYNRTHGGSLYTSAGPRGVAMRRPLSATTHSAHHPALNPISVLRGALGRVDVVAQSQIGRAGRPYDLGAYELVVLYGHDEYWTRDLLRSISEAVWEGTNLLNMSGNTAWRVLTANNGRIRRTGHWHNRRASVTDDLLGGSFRWAGYGVARTPVFGIPYVAAEYATLLSLGLPPSVSFSDAPHTTRGVRVLDASDPLFRGTGLADGDWIPGVNQVETDGFPLTPAGTPDTALVSAPRGLDVLADGWNWYGRLSSGPHPAAGSLTHSAVLRRHRFGRGVVTSLTSLGWMAVLATGDPVVTRITLNAAADLTTRSAPTSRR